MEKQEQKSHNKYDARLPFFGIPKLQPWLRRYQRRILLMVLLGAGTSFADAIYPLFNQYALNHFVAGRTLDTLGAFIGLFLAILAGQVVMNFFSASMAGKIEMSVDRDLRNASFNHLQELSFSYFNQNNVGYIHARVMSDTGRIGEMVSWDLMEFVWQGAYLLFVLINMFLLNARLAILILAIVPAAAVLIAWFQKRLIFLNRQVREINSTITGNFNEGITGAMSIKSMVIEDRMQDDFKQDTRKMQKISVRTGRTNAAFTSLVTMMSSVTLAIVLWRGGMLTRSGVMLIGTLSVFMNYAINMLEPIQAIISVFSQLIAIQVNIERFTNLMSTTSDVADRPDVIERYGDTFHPKKENWEPLYGDIEFRDVSFRYPDGEEMVLEHFNLKVPRGTNVAIVGETGAGKSTLVNLVCRFYEPTRGQVLIDGRDARDRSQLWLHSHIGYVLQTPHLFSGTVRENLRYGKPDATDGEIWQALDLVDARKVVDKMPQGLDAEVGEGGDLLSAGEKQLLCFARAILANPAILILDEATASVDTLTEKTIQDAVFRVIRGRTSFVVAHRLSTIADADVILVVKDGKIIEQGRHQELLARHGYYCRLYTRQYEEMAADLVHVKTEDVRQ